MKNLREKIENVVNIYKSGNLVKTEDITKKLITENPEVPFLYNLLGLALTGQNKIEEAEKSFNYGISIDPNFAMFYNNLGLIYAKKKSETRDPESNIKKAEKFYKKSIELDEKIPEPKTNLGNLYHSINRFDESIKFHKMAIETNPNVHYLYLNLANVYITTGSFFKADESLRKAIKLNSNFFQAHRSLSRITKYTKNDPHIAELEKLYGNMNSNNSENKMHISFSLGKAYEDIREFDKSFFYYKTANSIHRTMIKFSLNEEIEKFKGIKKTYTEKLFKKFKYNACLNSNKIFIVGMPRSGTTLVEQILATHSKVFGAGEVEFIPDLIHKYFAATDLNLFLQGIFDFEKSGLQKMGEDYILRMGLKSINYDRTTDKFPANFLNIGLIRLILPKSKIVHCCRDPKDNIFSIYKNFFPGNKIKFSSDLNETIEYYKLYLDLMQHWNNLLPDFILNIKYENLIKNTEKEVKDLLKFCNLNWESDCLKFYKNKRPVKTASDVQVRSKIFNTSIDSWKNYEKNLNEYYASL